MKPHSLILVCMISSTMSIVVNNNTISRPGCPRCVQQDLLKQMTKEQIRRETLRKLGFTEAPVVTDDQLEKIQSISEYQIEKILNSHRNTEMMSDEPYDAHYHEDVSPLTNAYIMASQAPVPVPRFEPIYFNLSHIKDYRTLGEAHIYIHLPTAFTQVPTHGRLKVDVKILSVKKEKTTRKPYLQSEKTAKGIHVGVNGVAKLRITHLTRRWLNPTSVDDENNGLVLIASTNTSNTSNNLKRTLDIIQLDISTTGIYMELNINEMGFSRSRTTRSTVNNVCTDGKQNPDTSSCCMWPITVDFNRDFDWSFIVYPQTYLTYYCAGSCDIGTPADSSFGSLQQMLDKPLCCAPRTSVPMTMLYMAGDDLYKRKIYDMKVSRCGCV